MEVLGELWKVGGLPLAVIALLFWVLSQVFKTQRILTRTVVQRDETDPPSSDESTIDKTPPPRRNSKAGPRRDRAN